MSLEPALQHAIEEKLQHDFGLDGIIEFSVIRGGHLCKNYFLQTSKERYFLKQYRSISSVADIKAAEIFFFTHGFPVILPIRSNKGRDFFDIEEHRFSLFPFVDQISPRASELTKTMIASMGTTLAKMHSIGKDEKHTRYAPIRLWKREDFFASLHILETFLAKQESISPMQKFALNSLHIQEEYLEEHQQSPNDFSLPHDCLLHGDFIYTNLFFDGEGQIRSIYDFERTGMGPRAYELARSIFLTCFDDGWEERNYEMARDFLRAYTDVFPMQKDEYMLGARMYAQHFMHMTWLETKVILEKSGPHINLLHPARRRTVRFVEGVDQIVEKIWQPA
ncbi:MAG: phosphotransferase [Patescibacteria group bacterium]